MRNSLPVNTLPELIAFAKANPGKLNYGSTGIGTSPHLASEMLKRMAGIDFATVHYRGSAPALNDLLAESVDLVMDNTTSIAPHARAGSVRALGISTLRRWPLGKDYVPIADTVPGFEALAFTASPCAPARPGRLRQHRDRRQGDLQGPGLQRANVRAAGGGSRLRGPGSSADSSPPSAPSGAS